MIVSAKKMARSVEILNMTIELLECSTDGEREILCGSVGKSKELKRELAICMSKLLKYNVYTTFGFKYCFITFKNYIALNFIKLMAYNMLKTASRRFDYNSNGR